MHWPSLVGRATPPESRSVTEWNAATRSVNVPNNATYKLQVFIQCSSGLESFLGGDPRRSGLVNNLILFAFRCRQIKAGRELPERGGYTGASLALIDSSTTETAPEERQKGSGDLREQTDIYSFH